MEFDGTEYNKEYFQDDIITSKKQIQEWIKEWTGLYESNLRARKKGLAAYYEGKVDAAVEILWFIEN